MTSLWVMILNNPFKSCTIHWMLQLQEPLNIGQGKSWLGPYFFDFLQQGLNETYRYKTIKTFVGIEFRPNLSPARPLEGKMSPNSEKLTKIDFKMMLECSGRLQMKVLGIICWYLLKKWKKIEIWVGPNFVIMDFRGKIAVLRHLEWFLVKSEESRPP